MTPLAWTTLLLASSLPRPVVQDDAATGEAPAEDRAELATRVAPATGAPRSKPLEIGAQFGGMRILDNPVASSSLYLGGRASFRLPYQIVAGVVGQYDDFSSRTSTGSDFSFWATRAELGYELSESRSLSVLPYVELGYASTNTLFCTAERDCSRSLSSGSVGAVGLRFAALGEWFYSGFELNYQFGEVDTVFLGMNGGFRL